MELLSLPIDNFDLTILVITCFFGSMITTSVGAGGGLFVIASMSMILPATTLISLHAISQVSSGVIRSFVFRKSVFLKIFLLFSLGSILGNLLSIHFLVTLPEYVMKFILGLGIIILNFLPKFEIKNVSNYLVILVGTITGFLTMFIGAVGPLLILFFSSFIKQRYFMIGTLAWCLTVQNFAKVLTFGNLGFDYNTWLYLIVLLFFASYIGTVLGKKLFDKSNDVLFKKILKVVILILGSKLIYDASVLYFNSIL